MKTWGFTLSILLLAVLCVLGYIGYQAFNTGIEETKVTSITPGPEGFTMSGTLAVRNPSWIGLPLQSGEYKIIMEDSNEVLGTGTIEGKTLPPNQVTNLIFQQEMKWVPSGTTLMQLLLKEHVYAHVKGTITLDLFGLKQITLPFEQRIDLAQYVQAMKKNIVQNAAKAIFG